MGCKSFAILLLGMFLYSILLRYSLQNFDLLHVHILNQAQPGCMDVWMDACMHLCISVCLHEIVCGSIMRTQLFFPRK